MQEYPYSGSAPYSSSGNLGRTGDPEKVIAVAGNYVDVDVAGDQTFAIGTDGALYTWGPRVGADWWDALLTDRYLTPTLLRSGPYEQVIASATNFGDVAAVMLRQADGKFVALGLEEWGWQYEPDIFTPPAFSILDPPTGRTIVEIASLSGRTYFALDDTGQLWVAGRTGLSTLGTPNPDTQTYEDFVKVDTALRFEDIQPHQDSHSFDSALVAMAANGEVYSVEEWREGAIDDAPMSALPAGMNAVLTGGGIINDWGELFSMEPTYDPVLEVLTFEWKNQGKPPRPALKTPIQSCEYPS